MTTLSDHQDLPVYDAVVVPTEREAALIAKYHLQFGQDPQFQALADTRGPERRRKVEAEVRERLRADLILKGHEIDRLARFLADELSGLGPLQPLWEDPAITEIMVNGPRFVVIERNGLLWKTPITFRDDRHVLTIVQWVVGRLGRRLDQSTPRVDGRLDDGSRLHAIIHPIAVHGPYLTIRRFRPEPWTLADLTRSEALTPKMAAFIAAAVVHRCNVVIAGGTGSGKTSLLNAAGQSIPARERVITIEDMSELRLQHPQWLALEGRPPNVEGRGEVTLSDLVKEALRMRPDRLIVGEVRGPEAFAFLQAMNTGHPGSLLTIHANRPEEVLRRLETLVLMSGVPLTPSVIREYLVGVIDLILYLERCRDGRRRVVRISELKRDPQVDGELRDLFWFDPLSGRYRQSPEAPHAWAEMQRQGLVTAWDSEEGSACTG